MPSGRVLGAVVTDLAPLNRALLARREQLQAQIDEWCLAQRGRPLDMPAYKAFLSGIGYLVPEGRLSRSPRKASTMRLRASPVPSWSSRSTMRAMR